MPKGAALHVHLEASVNIDWVVKELTYWDNLYILAQSYADQPMELKFFASPPEDENWTLLSKVRASAPSIEDFDQKLKDKLAFTEAEMSQDRQNMIWSSFNTKFLVLEGMLAYEPAFRAYLNESMRWFHEDNVQYIEYRMLPRQLYNLDGQLTTYEECIKVFQETTEAFAKQHEDFVAPKLILSPMRSAPIGEMKKALSLVLQLKKLFPTVVIGFDLVGNEDTLNPLIDYVPSFLDALQVDPSLKFFYHAGETDRMNAPTDDNLVDALLMNTTRIGHGFAVLKHPFVLEQLFKRDIPIEFNPVSNQVLGLVLDLRNHPATVAILNSQPLVISSDDPPLWHALPMTHDFYVTFMAVSGLRGNLATVKKFALNSIRYSVLQPKERDLLTNIWTKKWDNFISSWKNYV